MEGEPLVMSNLKITAAVLQEHWIDELTYNVRLITLSISSGSFSFTNLVSGRYKTNV